MFKRLLSITLAVIMVSGCMVFTANAADTGKTATGYAWGTERTDQRTMKVGETRNFYITPTYNNVSSFNYSCDNYSVLNVSRYSTGEVRVTALKPGKATVTLEIESYYYGYNYDYKKDISHWEITVQGPTKTNPMTVSASGKTVKYKTVKKKSVTVKPIKVSKAKGKVTYTKKSGNGKITVNKSNGKVTVKKGIKKGTYKVSVKVRAAGDSTYKSKEKTVSFKIKVK